MKVVNIQGIAKVTKCIWLNLVLPALLLFATATEGWARYNIYGNVHARGIVPSPNGAPYWVEYDASGTALMGWVQEALPGSEYAIDKTRVLSFDEYKGYIARFQQLQQDYADHPNASKMLILRDGSSSSITLRNTVTGGEKTLNFADDALRFTKAIIVPPPDEVVGDTYIYNYYAPLLLAVMPVDPTDQPTHDKGALLLGEGGVILKESPYTIGFSTAFFIDEGGRTQSEDKHRKPYKHWLVNPLADVDVDMMMSADETDSAGDYHVYQPFMLCNIAAGSSGTHVSTYLSYQAFNPNNDTGIYPYFLMKLVPWRCQNLEFILAPGPAAFFGFGVWYLSAPSSAPRHWYDVDVDFSVINGRASLVNYIENPDGGVEAGDLIVAATDTTYGLQNSDGYLDDTIAPQIKAINRDFDGDGQVEVVVQGRIEFDAATGEKTFNTDPGIPEAERVLGVYLSSIGEPDGRLPDIYRRMDTLPLLQHQGLVTGISEEDLKNTDVYFFRKSTGELMAERTGSTLAYDKEKGGVTHHGVAVDEGEFYYTLHLRGSEANRYRAWSYNYSGGRDVETNEFIGTHHAFAGWQQDSGVNPEFQQRNSNYLRPGEWIQIIAINRATGYIGTVDFLLWNPGELSEDNGSAYKSMSRMVDDMEMHPPNLKIWAERKDVKAMGAQADIQDYVIGNEGAALQSDTIQIYTEWLDADGTPLPSALGNYGYTGRVAHVSDDNFTISNLGESANLFNGSDQTFSIKPGRHTEVINVRQMTNGNDHIYVQVSGEPHSRSFSFQRDIYKPDELSPRDKFKQNNSSEGAHEGIIAHRPERFVPFKVKVWDEIATEAVQLNYKQQKEANPDFAGQPPEPVYYWLYRPEFQYSVYDLTVEAIEREYNGTTANIYNPESDRAPVISSSDDLLQVLYTLEGSGYRALEGFSFTGDKHDQLTFALGDSEVQATVNQANQSIEFDNLDALAALDVEDFLSLRLYANNDANNILWEWAGYLNQAGKPLAFSRTHLLGRGVTVDDYQQVEFNSPDALVTIKLLDHDGDQVDVLVANQQVSRGRQAFILLREDLGAAIYEHVGVDFYLQVDIRDLATGNIETVTYPGELQSSLSSPMLGQIIQHDTLIQRGSLSIRREDIALTGAGPQLDFIRSYSNPRSALENGSAMGIGWTHNHDIRLTVFSKSGGGLPSYRNGLPHWVPDTREGTSLNSTPKIFSKAELEAITSAPVVPVMVSVSNGGTFELDITTGEWVPQRGHHGTLIGPSSESSDPDAAAGAWVYTAKDGSRYIFSEFSADFGLGKEGYHLSRVVDRNGNALTYSYITSLNRKYVKKVTDASARSLEFDYVTEGGLFRLNRVFSEQTGINISFDYFSSEELNHVGLFYSALKSFTRVNADGEDFKESYAYELAEGDFFPNLVSTTDALNHVTEYRYHSWDNAPAAAFDTLPGMVKTDIVKEVCYPAIGDCSEKASFQYLFNDNKHQRVVTDLRDNPTTYTLNAWGNAVRIDAPENQSTEFEWSIDLGEPDNVLRTKRDLAIGATWNYNYDSNGNVTNEVGPTGQISQTWHPKFNVLTSRTDQNGNQSIYEIDNSNGNLLSTTVKNARVAGVTTDVVVSHTYGTQNGLHGLRLSTKDARGKTTTFNYDDYGLIRSAIAPGSLETVYVNDNRGRRLEERDPAGNTIAYEYDDLDRITKVTDAEGNTVVSTYDAKGNKITEATTSSYFIDGAKHTQEVTLTYQYDVRDRVEEVSRSGNLDGTHSFAGVKTYRYDANSNITFESDWKGVQNTAAHVYDGLNRRTKAFNRAGDSMSISYVFANGEGLVKRTTDYEGRTTTERYDLASRLVKVEHPTITHSDGTSNSYERRISYDNLNNVTSLTDEEGKTTTHRYDSRNLNYETTDALNQVATTEYDANGNVTRTYLQASAGAAVSHSTTFEYDDLNRLSAKLTPENHRWAYTYFDNGNLKTQTDPWGFETAYTYDGVNQLTSITHTDGTEQVNYTKDGKKVFHRDVEGRVASTLYGPEERVLVATDAVGRSTTYTYDLNNNVTDITLAWSGAATGPIESRQHFVYDVQDRQIEAHTAFGTAEVLVAEYAYDKVGNKTQELRPEGRVVDMQYDELNRVKQITSAQTLGGDGQPLATITKQKFNGVGNLVWSQDRRGFATTTQYDDLHRVSIVTDALMQTLRSEYDVAGNLIKQTNKRGVTTESEYDELGRVTAQWVDDNSGERFRLNATEYDIEMGGGTRADKATDANNNAVVTHVDFRGNPIEITLPADAVAGFSEGTISHVYDRSGWLTQTTDAAGKVVSYGYHDDGTKASSTVNGTETTQFSYDLYGNVAVTTRPKGNALTHTYNARNHLVESADDDGSVTRFEYDVNGNLTHQYTPAANDEGTEGHVEYVYDALNRKRQHIQHKAANDAVNPGAAGNLVTLMGYDAEGNLTHTTDAKGQVFVTTYDELGRPTQQDFPAGSDITRIVSTYDANNNLDIVTEHKAGGTEVTDHDYDLLDRLTERVQRGHSVAYSYDNNGNRTSVTASGGSTTYTFDSRNRLHTAVANGLTSTYHYLQNGWLDTLDQGNGTQAQYDYDDAGRTTQIINLAAGSTPASPVVLSQFDYVFDANGNRTSEVSLQNGFASDAARTTSYTYDNLDRLTGYTHDQAGVLESHSFTYYPSFDRKTETVIADGVTQKARTFTYDETHWLTGITDTTDGSAGVISYQYDNNGNTLRKTDGTGQGPASTVMAYNSRNQLLSVAAGTAGAEVAQGQYHYNYAGMRIRHLGSARGDIEYVYDDNAIIDELVSGTATQVAHYRYGDRLLSLQTAEGEQFYHYSNIGTTANLSTPQGQNQVAYEVDPFGAITRQEGESVNRQVFTGHEHDTETGLIYMKARFYDPDSARFLTQDTYLGVGTEAPSLHRYMYAYSNPNYYWDPDGYESVTTMIDNAAEGCNAVTCAGWAALQAVYQVGTMGFASVHDPMRDAYDEGKISGSEYAQKGIGGGLALTAANLATGRAAGIAVAGTRTLAGKAAIGVGTGALIGAGDDVARQGLMISAGLQEQYNVNQTLTAAAIGGVIGGVAPTAVAVAPKLSQAAKTTIQTAQNVSKTVVSRGVTVARDLTGGGNVVSRVGQSVVGKAKQATATIISNATTPGPVGLRRQIGAVGDISKIRLGQGTSSTGKTIDGLEDIYFSSKTKSGVPGIDEGFAKWFNDLSEDQLSRVMKNPSLKESVDNRIRYPGKMHEWLKVSKIETFKRWGVKMEDIWALRTPTKTTGGINPSWTHGRKGSPQAHTELDEIIDNSLDFNDFKRKLRNWANYRLKNGVNDLPEGLRN